MLSIKSIIWVKEEVPHESLKGEIRKPCYPLDRFCIEDITYRISELVDKGETFLFKAVKV